MSSSMITKLKSAEEWVNENYGLIGDIKQIQLNALEAAVEIAHSIEFKEETGWTGAKQVKEALLTQIKELKKK